MVKRSPPLTKGVLRVLDDCINAAEAGGYIEQTQSMDGGEEGKEADRWRADAVRAHAWLLAQFQKRARRKDGQRG